MYIAALLFFSLPVAARINLFCEIIICVCIIAVKILFALVNARIIKTEMTSIKSKHSLYGRIEWTGF